MMHVRILVLMVVLITKPDGAYQFILDNSPCVVFPPCSCSGRDIYCDGKGLTQLPAINYLNTTNGNGSLNLRLADNQLETLPSLFFQNLTNLPVKELYLYLQDNSMRDVQINAFGGIENKIVALNLDNNNLTYIPSELGNLSNLRSLYLNNNSISRLGTSILTLRKIGRSLKSLSIDLQHFTSCSRELTYLHFLSNLTLLNVQQTHLDIDTFDSFNGSMKSLYIKNSNLEKVPTSVCRLDNLLNFEFSHNHNLHLNSTWIDPSCRSLANLSSINMEYNNLRYMPNLPAIFNTEVVRLSHNRLSYIEDMSNFRNVRTFILDHNNFTRIPYVIGWKLIDIFYLDMQYNDIRSIEQSDFPVWGAAIKHLILNYNPIEYISLLIGGFPALQTLELAHTNIHTVAAFLRDTQSLQYVNLESNPTECSCKLSFLKGWNVTNVKIKGYCDKSPFTVKSFLMTELPLCP